MTRQRFDTLVRSSGTVKSFAVGGASECERGVTEGQRKTTENRERHPVGAQRSGVRWRGSNTWVPGAGPRVAFAENLRAQGSGLSTRLRTQGNDVFFCLEEEKEV